MKFMVFFEVSPPFVWLPKVERSFALVRWQWLCFALAVIPGHDFNDMMAAQARVALRDPEGLLREIQAAK
jgi:hypothetical protein